MAPLTYRNVDAPNFSNVGESLRTAALLLGNGTSGLADALASFSKQAQAGDSSAALAAALGYTDDASFGAALRSGAALGGINPRNIDPNVLRTIGERQNALIRNDGLRLTNAGQGIQNNASQFNLDESRAAAARGNDYRANQPAANEVLTRARALYDSGNAAQIAEGRKLITDNSKLFTSAGMSASDILNTMVSNTAAAGQGIQLGQQIAADEDFYTERFRKQGQKGVLNGIVSDPTVTDAASAIQKVQAIQGLDAQTKSNLVKDLQDNAGTYFPVPSVLDTLPVRNASPTAILQDASGNQTTGGNMLPTGFRNALDRTEGGGNYDTLFGNAQRNGPFAGTSVSNMTIGQAIDFANPSGAYGQHVKEELRRSGQKARVATPMGRHQIVGSTLAAAAREMGLDPNTPFNEQTQDAVALHIAKKAISGPRTMTGKIEALRGQWEGFKNLPDSQVASIVQEIEGTPAGTAANPIDVNSINRNAVVYNGGVPSASGILGQFGGAGFDQATVPSTPVVAAADAISGTNNSTNTTSNDVQTPNTPVEQTPAERNAALLADLQKVQTGAGEAYRDTNGQLFTQSPDGQFTQIDSSGIPIGGSAYQPQVLATAARATTPASQVTDALTPTQLLQNAQTVANTGVVDQLSNNQATLENLIATRPDRGKTVAEIAAIVADKTGTPKSAATQAINEIMRDNNVDADVAGYLAQQSPESRDLSFSPLANLATLGLGNMFFAGDRFGRATEGRTGQRIDTNRASELLKNFRTQNSAEAGANTPGVSRLNTNQRQQQAAAQIQMLQVQAQALQGRVLALTAALQRNPNNPDVRAALQTAQQQLEVVNTSLNQINRQGDIAPYIRSNVSQ